MILSIYFHEFAEAELNDAAKYYESKVKGLGTAFLSEVERSSKLIQNNPELFPRILKVVRRKTLSVFLIA